MTASDPLVGFAFPFHIGSSRSVAQQTGDAKLKENIVQLLLTGIGERVMRRDYGGGLRQVLHDPDNDALRAIVQHQIAKMIAQYEPRVAVVNVTVAPDPVAVATLNVDVQYVVRRTQQPHSLSVPIGLGGV